MVKVFKWLWDKAEKHGEQKVIAQLLGLRSYHMLKAELTYMKTKYEPDDHKREDDVRRFMSPVLTAQEHSAIAGMLGDFVTNYDEQQEASK